MTWQPEQQWSWPGSGDREQVSGAPGAVPAASRARAAPPARRVGRRRRGLRVVTFSLLVAVGLAGLGAAAVGVAHQLLPRHFTAAQRRQIIGWEMERRWRVLSAGKIFPAAVPYTVSASALESNAGLTLQAQRLAISPPESCSAALSATAASVLDHNGCATALRATYVDSSGGMVGTVVVAVLPAGATASKVVPELGGTAGSSAAAVQAFPVPGTQAALFGDSDRQLSDVAAAGPYLILSTAGFADDRGEQVSADSYDLAEMTGLADGLVSASQHVLGKRPPTPVCPGAPGC